MKFVAVLDQTNLEGACIVGKLHLKPGTGIGASGWQPVELLLAGDRLSTGAWYAPKLLVFSVGLESRGSRVEIDALRLLAASGRELLRNGDFEQGLAHWYFSSDRHHLPWHLKSLARHLLFEQGWLGLTSFAALAVAAAWRLAFGRARGHLLAPPLAAALAGLLGVGLVDSLLDIPRVAFLGYLLLAVAVGLRSPTRVPPRSPRVDSGASAGP